MVIIREIWNVQGRDEKVKILLWK